MPVPVGDLDQEHDPGPSGAMLRSESAGDAGAQPIDLDGHEIRVGTASWTDPTMTAAGVFYPPGADSAEERLQYYASQFPLVEVDATYYALPYPRMAELWRDRTPPDFTFDVKAHALLTGQPSETKRLPKDIRTALPEDLAAKARIYARDLPRELSDELFRLFREGLEPLVESGQLGAILLQYPRWVFPSSESRDAIVEAKERLADAGVGRVPPRQLVQREERGADAAVPVGPRRSRSSSSMGRRASRARCRWSWPRRRRTWRSSGSTAVGRRPGRRRASRPSSGSGTCTTRASSRSGRPGSDELARQARETHVLMNNCYANYGSTNAREMAALLEHELEGAPV